MLSGASRMPSTDRMPLKSDFDACLSTCRWNHSDGSLTPRIIDICLLHEREDLSAKFVQPIPLTVDFFFFFGQRNNCGLSRALIADIATLTDFFNKPISISVVARRNEHPSIYNFRVCARYNCVLLAFLLKKIHAFQR